MAQYRVVEKSNGHFTWFDPQKRFLGIWISIQGSMDASYRTYEEALKIVEIDKMGCSTVKIHEID